MSDARAELDEVHEVIVTAMRALGAARRRVEDRMAVAEGQEVLEVGEPGQSA